MSRRAMSLPIQDTGADYVLSVKHELKNHKGTLSTSEEAQGHLKQLIEKLDSKGFASDIRAGDKSSVLVFVRLLSSKFQEIGERDLLKNYEFGVTASKNTPEERLRLVYEYLTTPESLDGAGVTPGAGDWKFVNSVIPITEALRESTLLDDAKAHITSPSLKTSHLKETYGVKIALYFEFLKHFIIWLVPLSILGLISHLKSKGRYSLSFTILNLIWGVLFIGFWRKRERYLVNFWGVQNIHFAQKNYSKVARINEKSEENSSYKQDANTEGITFFKELGFVPIAILFTLVLVSVQLGCFVLEIFLSEVYDGPGNSFLAIISTIVIAVFVPIFTIVFNTITDIEGAWENHQTHYNLKKSKLIKMFVVNFLTSYVPLVITSFIYLPFAHLIKPNLGEIQRKISSNINENRFYFKYLTTLKKQEDFKINQERLNGQFFFFVVTNQVIQIVLKYALPLALAKIIPLVKSFISKETEKIEIQDDKNESKWLANVRTVSSLPEYNVDDDFRGLVSSFGYLIMFGSVWSIAPLATLIFLVLTFKLDSLKLASGKYFRPPIPEQVDSIQPWNFILIFLTWLGSIVSTTITIFYRHGTKPPKTLGQLSLESASTNVSSSSKLALTVFLVEHFVVALILIFSKSFNYFKSDKERENDFFENDIKLRRDYYSSQVKSSVIAPADGIWSKISSKAALQKVATIPSQVVLLNGIKSDTEKENGSASVQAAGYSSSIQRSSADVSERVVKQKRTVLSEREEKLDKLKDEARKSSLDELSEVADKSDSIVESKDSNGAPVYATIDNNNHIDEDSPLDYSVDQNGATESQSGQDSSNYTKDNTESDSSTRDTANILSDEKAKLDNDVNDRTTKKKKSLRKILKKKK